MIQPDAKADSPNEVSAGKEALDEPLSSLPTDEVGELIAALNAPSYEQDSRWHNPNGTYATKPRDLLTEAASTLSRLRGEREELRAMIEKFCRVSSIHQMNTLMPEARSLLSSEGGEAAGEDGP